MSRSWAKIAGVDEAGRGPLAGPVTVAAVILDPAADWSEVDDSKRLSAGNRKRLAEQIRRGAFGYHVEFVDVAIIDRMNILQATLWGMSRAIDALDQPLTKVLVDGNRAPKASVVVETIIGGDATEKCIGAASVLAKTARDEHMIALDEKYPGYGFADNKGYPTPEHLQALRELGPTPEHRRSFAPVREQLQGQLFVV